MLKSIIKSIGLLSVASIFLLLLFYSREINIKSQPIINSSFILLNEDAKNTSHDNVIKPKSIKLIFGGDVMLAREIGKIILEKNDPLYFFKNIASTTRDVDFAIINLENPVSKLGTRAEPLTLIGLAFAGIALVSLANNHIWDYGRDAVLDTFNNLASSGINYVGAGRTYDEAHSGFVKEIKGVKFGFLSHTDLIPMSVTKINSSPAISYLNEKILIEDIKRIKEKSDIVIILIHWGDEYSTSHNKNQEKLAHIAIDAGANLVIGHHPHVTQGIEEYKNGLIAYSLGNLVFDQNFDEYTSKSFLLEVEFEGLSLSGFNKIPIYFEKDFLPVLGER